MVCLQVLTPSQLSSSLQCSRMLSKIIRETNLITKRTSKLQKYFGPDQDSSKMSYGKI